MNRRHFLKLVLALIGSSRFPGQWNTGLAQANAQFIIPPTIQHVTETTATLYFRLKDLTSTGELLVKQADTIVQTIPLVTDALRQQILIEDLEPSTAYTYEVQVDGSPPPTYDDDAWQPLSFNTAPFEYPLRFCALGDSGFGHPTTRTLGTAIAQHELDFFLHLGDVVYWMHEYNNDHFYNYYVKYFKPFGDILRQMPHYPTMGNHDYDGPTFLDELPTYNWVFPPFGEDEYEGLRYWYSFQFNDIHFISLNSQLIYGRADLRNMQIEWLDEQLARDDSLYKVVFFHIAPFHSSDVHPGDGLPIAEQWLPKFEASNVKLVLTGHAHLYERLERNGITYIVAGAGSAINYTIGTRLPSSKTVYNGASYPIIELYEDKIGITAYDVDGNVIDEVEIEIALPIEEN